MFAITKNGSLNFYRDVDLHTVVICQHVTPIHIGSTTSVADASLL